MVVYNARRIEPRSVLLPPPSVSDSLSSPQCDENKPKCGRCERIGFDCSLAERNFDLIFIPDKRTETEKEQANAQSPDSGSNSSRSSNAQSVDLPKDLQSMTVSTTRTEQLIDELHFTDLEMERLRLMNHYTLYTSRSIAEITISENGEQSIWSNWVTELALNNDFLLHGILSLSALHLALCGVSRQKYLVMAIHHHSVGLALFRPHLSNITADEFDAVFAFSCLVALYSFGIQRCSEPGVNPIARIHQVLTLIRRSAVLVKCDYEKLERSRWSVLMVPVPHQHNLPEEMENMLSTLLQRISTTISAATQEELYTSAIQTLRESLTVAISYQRAISKLTWFPIMSPTDFWPQVCIGEPLALAILANYAVVLHWLRKSVWMEGWGRETVGAVRQALPPGWQECIAWAIRETGLD